jgi:hypothetical protein
MCFRGGRAQRSEAGKTCGRETQAAQNQAAVGWSQHQVSKSFSDNIQPSYVHFWILEFIKEKNMIQELN